MRSQDAGGDPGTVDLEVSGRLDAAGYNPDHGGRVSGSRFVCDLCTWIGFVGPHHAAGWNPAATLESHLKRSGSWEASEPGPRSISWRGLRLERRLALRVSVAATSRWASAASRRAVTVSPRAAMLDANVTTTP